MINYYSPAAFHFKVIFSGIDAKIETESSSEGGENMFVHQLPAKVTHDSLVLKRGIAPIESELVTWCRDAVLGGFSRIQAKSCMCISWARICERCVGGPSVSRACHEFRSGGRYPGDSNVVRSTAVNPIDRATILYFHRHRMAAFGECSLKSLGWRGEDSQRKRFEVIAGAGEFSGCSVLDVGCGRGDLKRFLDKRFTQFSYIGLDHVPEFIAQARQAYEGVAETWFFECDFSALKWPIVDYVVASGALRYRTSDSGFHFDMMQKMYDSAQCAAIFNILDAKVFSEDPLLVGRDTDELVAFCKGIAPGVQVITGYLEDDVTICLYRDRCLPAVSLVRSAQVAIECRSP